MADPSQVIDGAPPHRSKPFSHAKVIKKTTGLFKSKRFHIQLAPPLLIAIVSFVIGILYLHNCPIEPYIPIYLIVQGAVGLLILVIHVLAFVHILYITKFKYQCIGTVAIFMAFIMIFLFAWFIAGNFWIFSVVNRVQLTDQTKTNSYCNKNLYQAAFWLLIAQYVMSVYFCCSFTWIRQSSKSPTNGVIKVRKQIPKIKRMLTIKNIQQAPVSNTADTRL